MKDKLLHRLKGLFYDFTIQSDSLQALKLELAKRGFEYRADAAARRIEFERQLTEMATKQNDCLKQLEAQISSKLDALRETKQNIQEILDSEPSKK